MSSDNIPNANQTYKVPILTNSANYPSWSRLMYHVLKAEDLWDITIGNEVEPKKDAEVYESSENSYEDDLKLFQRKCSKALAQTLSTVSPAIVADLPLVDDRL